jgi:hypothetical protein
MEIATIDEQLRIEGFQKITRLEIGLRRLLERELKGKLGERWWKALPQDVKEKVREASLDYVDFPDLKKCISSKWSELACFHDKYRKDHVVFHLEELEPIRNDLAHSRNITSRELALVNAAYSFFEPLLSVVLPQSRRRDHPGATLLRVHQTIERDALIARADLEAVRKLDESVAASSAYEALATYNGVRRQRRNTRAERERSRAIALDALVPLLSSVTVTA